MNDLNSHALDGINEFISDFQLNPFAYLCESDLKSILFGILRRKLPGTINVPSTNNNCYKLNRVYSEYLNRIDVACLDEKAVDSLEPIKEKGHDTYIYRLPVFLGIEMKYIYMGYRKGFDILRRDFEKLTGESAYKQKIQNWLVLGFLQSGDTNKAFFSDMNNTHSPKKIESIADLNKIYIVTPNDVFWAQPKIPGE